MMKKETYLSEIKHIKEWIITILDFMTIKNPSFKQFSEITKENLLQHNNTNINQKIYKGFREAYRDINEMTKSLSPIDYKQLNTQLTEKFGVSLGHIDKSITKTIEAILKKGKISTREEYILLLKRIDEIYADHSKEDEVECLNKLLAAFDEKQ